MRHILSFAALVTLTACFNPVVGNGDAVQEVRNLSPSTRVRLAGPFDVDVVTDGDLDVAEISCDSNLLEHIVTELDENGHLVLRVARGVSIQPRATCHIDLKLSQAPQELHVSGSGEMIASGRLPDLHEVGVSGSGALDLLDGAEICDLSANVSGSGSVDLGDLQGCSVDGDVSGSGSMTASGQVASIDMRISGSGDMFFGELGATTAVLRVSGSGDGEFTVSDSVDARISGSGTLTIHGNPETRDVNTSGSGNISFD